MIIQISVYQQVYQTQPQNQVSTRLSNGKAVNKFPNHQGSKYQKIRIPTSHQKFNGCLNLSNCDLVGEIKRAINNQPPCKTVVVALPSSITISTHCKVTSASSLPHKLILKLSACAPCSTPSENPCPDLIAPKPEMT